MLAQQNARSHEPKQNLIRGGLVEHSNDTPSAVDYQLGYEDDNGDFVPTLWIDTATGDLDLRGTLSEADGNIPMIGGYSAFVNKRGIILALYDSRTGNLVLRGNLVPYRRTI